MFADGRRRNSEDHADLGIRFSLGEPQQHLALTWCETVMLAGPSFAILGNQFQEQTNKRKRKESRRGS